MDVVTHGMMGAILASPLATSHPLTASCLMLGSAIPDLDTLSRVLGKRAFLEAHRTYTHSIPIMIALGGLAWIGFRWAGFQEPWAAPALVMGMFLHGLLDVTNTYGITPFAPFSMRRIYKEWVFFIDAIVIAVTAATLIVIGLRGSLAAGSTWVVPAVYAAALAAYWAIKIALRRRALRLAPQGTLSLMPSALVPWHFLGYAREGSEVRLFRIDARDGALAGEEWCAIHDEEWAGRIGDLPEFRIMRGLSAAYHVVEVKETPEGTRIECKDLRTRNFRTRFGDLDLLLDPRGGVLEKTFHV